VAIEQGGFSAGEMLNHVPGIDGARRERLIRVLDIDPDWQMNKVSDGQRRRVQIAIGLLRPFKVAVPCDVCVPLVH
jgi:CCR4-NOT complex subunit CAF16